MSSTSQEFPLTIVRIFCYSGTFLPQIVNKTSQRAHRYIILVILVIFRMQLVYSRSDMMQGARHHWLLNMKSTMKGFFLTPRRSNAGSTTQPMRGGMGKHCEILASGLSRALLHFPSQLFCFLPCPPTSCLHICRSHSERRALRLVIGSGNVLVITRTR